MNFGVIRNKRQTLDLIEKIKQMRLPFKYAFQAIYPLRSIDFNDYLWGFIYTPIADSIGQTPEEVHEAYKRKYNFRVDFIYNKQTRKFDLDIGAGSTTELDMKEAWDYAAKVCADAELELHLILQLPNECFVPELDFDHDKIELRRI